MVHLITSNNSKKKTFLSTNTDWRCGDLYIYNNWTYVFAEKIFPVTYMIMTIDTNDNLRYSTMKVHFTYW